MFYKFMATPEVNGEIRNLKMELTGLIYRER